MNYRKLAAKYFVQRSNSKAQIAVALVAGLAAGAVISILFAPDRGDGTRRRISDSAKNLGSGLRGTCSSLLGCFFGTQPTADDPKPEVPHFKHATAKKRKSNIKEIIQEAHQPAEKTGEEQA